MSARPPVIYYRPEIDGLRAVAVSMVVLFHAGISVISGGFVGVDMFFVISGYLIAGIVLRETEAGIFSFAEFYERRVRRIVPALLAMLAVSSVLSLILLPEDLLAYAKSLLAVVTFSSNFYFWRSLGYFGIDPQYAPLLNTWSLAVEEQLYLAIPALLALVAARFGRRGTAVFIVASGILALLAGYAIDGIPDAGFFWPMLRAAEFLLGAFLSAANLPIRRGRWIGDALATIGFVLIASDLPHAYLSLHFPWREAVLASVGSALIIHGTQTRGSLVARILSARPLVVLGLASYSLYLWHWPIIAFGTYYIIDEHWNPAAKIALALASVPVALLSWRYVERPFRDRSIALSRRDVFAGAAGSCFVLALLAGAVVIANGVPGRFNATTLRIVEDRVRVHNPCDSQSTRSVAEGELCKLGSPQSRPSFIISGDSHADMYFEALDALARRNGVSGYMFSSPACRAYIFVASESADQNCASRNVEVRKLIILLRPKAIIIAERWDTATFARQAAARGDPRGALWLVQLDRGLAETARLAKSAGSRLYIVRDVPEAHAAVTRTLAKARILGLDDPDGNPPAYLNLDSTRAEFEQNEAIADKSFEALAAQGEVHFLDPAAFLCDARHCYVQRGGFPLYRDIHHLNREGASLVTPAFAPLMQYLTGRGTAR